MAEISNNFSLEDIATIFSAHLNCPDRGDCEGCVLNETKIAGRRVGCLKLRDMAMQDIVNAVKEVNNGEND